MDRDLRPCVYPGCRDTDGDPRITRDVICETSRPHFRRLLTEWLPLDYVTVRATMPTPAGGSGGPKIRTSSTRSYGHPAEWASDTLAAIAGRLYDAEVAMRVQLTHPAAVDRRHSEAGRVRLAIRYLDRWFEALCVSDIAGDTAAGLLDVHHLVGRALGRGRQSVHLPVPCPHCDWLTLFRTFSGFGQDTIDCRACKETLTDAHYQAYSRSLADEAIRDDEPDDDDPDDAAAADESEVDACEPVD
jgi:hypothetical protein